MGLTLVNCDGTQTRKEKESGRRCGSDDDIEDLNLSNVDEQEMLPSLGEALKMMLNEIREQQVRKT